MNVIVQDRMSRNPITITETTPILEAGELMRKHNFARLPVVRDGKVVGIITQEDLLKVSPSAATTLSVWELNYVLSKLLVKEAMTKEVVTIEPEATLEEAALLMRSKSIGALPVVKDGKLVGIITESDIFDAFIDLMGLKETGTRLTLDLENRIGVIAEVTEIIKEQGINIISMALFHRENKNGELVLRLDRKDCGSLVDLLNHKGYKVVHVATWA